MNKEQVKALLKQQRENCLKQYTSYYAGSAEDYAPPCIINDIVNAPEPAFILSNPINIKEELVNFLTWYIHKSELSKGTFSIKLIVNEYLDSI